MHRRREAQRNRPRRPPLRHRRDDRTQAHQLAHVVIETVPPPPTTPNNQTGSSSADCADLQRRLLRKFQLLQLNNRLCRIVLPSISIVPFLVAASSFPTVGRFGQLALYSPVKESSVLSCLEIPGRASAALIAASCRKQRPPQGVDRLQYVLRTVGVVEDLPVILRTAKVTPLGRIARLVAALPR